MNNKLMPALIAGGALGVASAILSNIPLVNLCCCLLAIGAGAFAVMLYVKKSPTQVSIGEGAMMGAMAGAVGGVIYFVLATIIGLIIGAAFYEAQMRQFGSDVPFSGLGLVIAGAFIGALVLVALATIGGLIGIPIFEKRKGGGAPPPPPYGGGAPGGGTPADTGYSGGSYGANP